MWLKYWLEPYFHDARLFMADRDEVGIPAEQPLHGEHDEPFLLQLGAHDYKAVVEREAVIDFKPQGVLKPVADDEGVIAVGIMHVAEMLQRNLPGPPGNDRQGPFENCRL